MREKLLEFKSLTDSMIYCIEHDDIEAMDGYIEKRQGVIEAIEGLDYTQEQFKEICSDLNLLKGQQVLSQLIVRKKDELKDKISDLREKNTANRNYARSSMVNRSFFNKKI